LVAGRSRMPAVGIECREKHPQPPALRSALRVDARHQLVAREHRQQ